MSAALPESQHHLVKDWLSSYSRHFRTTQASRPNYFANEPQVLTTTSRPIRFSIGNGHQLISSISQACLDTEQELLLVTCFWADSSSRNAICDLLRELSQKALSQNRRIQVRICFSSLSAFQKIFQTSSLQGKFYSPDSWNKALGLPHPHELTGLDMVIKSIFVRPFSVMHPKFVLIDRHKAFMPSCNVSWESWFEGCVEMEGGICEKLFEFWSSFWLGYSQPLENSWIRDFVPRPAEPLVPRVPDLDLINYREWESHPSIQTILLPSPHHANPRFSPFSKISLPPTPLNNFVEEALNSAKYTIYIQTPNLTCRPLNRALIRALKRGVQVTIVTSSMLMIFEQLATAFTITEFEIWKLRRRYNKLIDDYLKASDLDPEHYHTKPGDLRVGYYHARFYEDSEQEPVKSHLKLTVTDSQVVILGSGNMDRASFFTSQELGVAFIDANFAREVMECTEGALTDRVRWVRDR